MLTAGAHDGQSRSVTGLRRAGGRFPSWRFLRSLEVRTGMLPDNPGTATVLAVSAVKAFCMLGLASGVPGHVRVTGFELAECPASEAAAVPVHIERDLVQQADTADLADSIDDVAKRTALADDRELEGRYRLTALDPPYFGPDGTAVPAPDRRPEQGPSQARGQARGPARGQVRG